MLPRNAVFDTLYFVFVVILLFIIASGQFWRYFWRQNTNTFCDVIKETELEVTVEKPCRPSCSGRWKIHNENIVNISLKHNFERQRLL